MRKKESGFTLIELMIVIAIIAIIAAIAIPNLLSARLNSNETAAIATLRNIISAQSQFQTTARADGNANGVGEYGVFSELSGATDVRQVAGTILNPPVLSSAFQNVLDDGGAGGYITRSGYLYKMFLPGVGGVAVAEDGANPGGMLAALDDDLAETTWCCYAWPADAGNTGNRTFFVNQAGDILGMDNQNFDGPGAGPAGDAAFSAAGDITSAVDINGAGQVAAPVPATATWRQVG